MQVAPVGAAQTYQPMVRPAAGAERSSQVVQGAVVAPEAPPAQAPTQAADIAAATPRVSPDSLQVAMQQTMAGLGGRFVG